MVTRSYCPTSWESLPFPAKKLPGEVTFSFHFPKFGLEEWRKLILARNVAMSLGQNLRCAGWKSTRIISRSERLKTNKQQLTVEVLYKLWCFQILYLHLLQSTQTFKQPLGYQLNPCLSIFSDLHTTILHGQPDQIRKHQGGTSIRRRKKDGSDPKTDPLGILQEICSDIRNSTIGNTATANHPTRPTWIAWAHPQQLRPNEWFA